MKVLPILAGVVLPLVAGLLHPEVRAAMSAGRWPSVFGAVLGFNGLFALGGGTLAAIFSAKSRVRAAWISVAVAVAVSGLLSGSSGVIAERVEKISQEADAQKVTAWNQQNHGRVLLTFQKSAREKVKTWRSGAGRVYEVSAPGLTLIGTIENKSGDKIVAVIIDYKVMNKDLKQVIVSRRLKLPLEVFPTAVVAIERTFAADTYKDDAAVDEIHRASEQLGAAYAWSYEFIAAIPQSLELTDFEKGLKVEASLSLKE